MHQIDDRCQNISKLASDWLSTPLGFRLADSTAANQSETSGVAAENMGEQPIRILRKVDVITIKNKHNEVIHIAQNTLYCSSFFIPRINQ